MSLLRPLTSENDTELPRKSSQAAYKFVSTSSRKLSDILSSAAQPPGPEVRSAKSAVLGTGPSTHRLPAQVLWRITLWIAVAMACINFATVLAIEYSVIFKFALMRLVINHSGVGCGIIMLMVVSMCYSLVGVCLIECFAPSCGGSGLPENKCYLNGSNIPGFFTKRTLRVRVLSVILSNAAGFPVGREGPTVVIGSNVAHLISHRIARPYVEEWIDFSRPGTDFARIVDEERFADATRIACAIGGACGMAMIFNAPFGGFLYMFEEVTSVSWPMELTFKVFVATMMCALVSYGLLNLFGRDIFEFVIFVVDTENDTWKWGDVPLIIFMSAILGVLTSIHTRACLAMAGVRQQVAKRLQSCQPFARIIETVLYCGLCAFISAGTALLAECDKQESNADKVKYVQFNCEEGMFNPIASLLVTTSHSSVRLLFSSANAGEISKYAAILAFAAYYLLNVCLTGLPVPGGAFTATMLLGALFGRFFGEVGRELGLCTTVSGVYAVVGSAAMLCGFKQMTLAVVLIVVECVNNMSLAPVTMLAVAVSMAVNWLINEKGHDEEQIFRKKLPFLDAEPPRALDNFVSGDLVDAMPSEVVLQPQASIDSVKTALEQTKTYDFPIVDPRTMQCVGIVTRPYLEAALQASSSGSPSGNKLEKSPLSRAFLEDPFRAQELARERLPTFIRQFSGGMQNADKLPLHRIMDPTPLTIVEDMPAPRLYLLVSRAGERNAIVVTRTGEFLGIISRMGLIELSRRAHAQIPK